MPNVKIGLMLIASSAVSLVIPPIARAEVYPQYIEIVKAERSSPCQCVSNSNQLTNSDPIGTDDAFILNDDKIGDEAIAKFGCDCAAHRRSVFVAMASAAKKLINQIN